VSKLGSGIFRQSGDLSSSGAVELEEEEENCSVDEASADGSLMLA
jgi:hypothetical protein